MPNRIIKESICSSDNIESLSVFAETFFYRLLVNCDDYGLMDARLSILKSRLFPLRTDSEMPAEKIKNALLELERARLIILYEVEGRPYLKMRTWEKHQQIRTRHSKYPDPNGQIITADDKPKKKKSDDSNGNQVKSDDSNCSLNPIQSNPNQSSSSISPSSPKPMMDEDEAEKRAGEISQILEAAERAGFSMSQKVMERINELAADYPAEWMLKAIDSCVDHGAVTIAYLRRVLEEWSKAGGPTDKRKQSSDYDDYVAQYGGFL